MDKRKTLLQIKIVFYAFWTSLIFTQCNVYRQDIMFQLDETFSESQLSVAAKEVERNYTIQPGDQLILNVNTNKGEILLEPTMQSGVFGNQNMANLNQQQDLNARFYLVQKDGRVRLPVVDWVYLQGQTLAEAEGTLQNLYDTYYQDSFVKLRFNNKRVVVLGALGGKVVSLTNENTTLLEVIALAGGPEFGAKVNNVKVIRGNLQQPEVYQIDLTTLSGMQQSMIVLQPGDVIYVEPWRRIWRQTLQDISPLLSLVSSLLALTLVLQNLNP